MHNARNVLIASLAILAVLVALLMYDPDAPAGDDTDTLFLHCAAGMKPPVEKIAERYKNEYGVQVQINYSGSGALLSGIKVSNAGDLYLAADEDYIRIAQEAGLVREAIPVATIHPVIAVRRGNPEAIRTVQDLLREDVSFAFANPEAASIGRTVQAILEQSGKWNAVMKAIQDNTSNVTKPTVSDVANDIKLGTVDAGIVWDSTAKQFPELETVEVPVFAGHREQITIGVLESTEHPQAALRFARYLTARDRGLPLFAEEHYTPVDGDIWAEVPELKVFSGGVNRLALEKTLREFKQREGIELVTVYNGCGILVAQMKATSSTGQLPDAYFSCDVSFMTQVSDIFPESTDVADTAMVMIVQKDNPKNVQSLHDLQKEELRVGIADQQKSALGALTKNLMIEAGVDYGQVLKYVEVTTPTADMLVNELQVGALDVAVVYEANCVNVRDKVEILRIDHPRAMAIQPFAIHKDSQHQFLTQRLFDAIQSAKSRDRFTNGGFNWRAG